ncbi:electron transfer flavoprotein subunit alpha/FixB family protein [Uliginosibacterium aquaticum]|uniref:Electron transfer flavoprotein subunit alpha/FixB family protein n=1 Tax=Uliginosibacterium aquaticum TaxID=2731212 RepID=A0ABX2IFM4_9RHOO|nr:electron transfer flavoprotein subunit alpha/FixB family protein [Uliginosibacterium aquaticum]NSL55549.1 electron transfer flavoprotein subunit alpha/FixB family protein [Uliginosibacterium aquaticum]
MKILVLAEHDNIRLKPLTARLLGAAQQLGAAADLLVIGAACQAVAEQGALLAGVARVRQLDAPHYAHFSVENLAMVLAQLAGSYTHVLLPATPFGKALAPRVAAMLDVAPVSGVTAIVAGDCFVRPTHAGNVLETVLCPEPVKVLTLRPAAFAATGRQLPAVIESLAPGPEMGVSRQVAQQRTNSARPELATARVVVAGGRGLGSADAFRDLLEPLADCLGAALAATRAAVDANYASNDLQVGQTGCAVAPELYIAVGISGAQQHLAGMRDAKWIVAINTDPEAPIFKVADLALVGDAHEIVPQLIAALRG